MNVRHTFSEQSPQQKGSRKKRHRASKRSSIAATDDLTMKLEASRLQPTANYEDILDVVLQLPQELVDMIKEALLDTFFCPGYYLPQVYDQDTHSWRCESHRIARPEMLLLNTRIHEKYHLRMRMENTYVVRLDSGLYFEVVPVYGHRDTPLDPYRYVIGQTRKHFPWLMMEFSELAGPVDELYRGHGGDYEVRRLFGILPTIDDDRSLMFCYMDLIDKYDSAGAWTGVELSEDFIRVPYISRTCPPPSKERSQTILWKAFRMMCKQAAIYHTELVPELANQQQKRRVYMILAGIHIYLFL
ncbi:MAG: hypothetical protein Q9169_003106 [Polycauliona sp. 2 TL-2023]